MTDLSIAIDNDTDPENVGENGASTAKPRKSMRAAINAYCKECTYDDAFKGGGTWRQQTEACTVTKCPLYELRPVSKPRKTDEEGEE